MIYISIILLVVYILIVIFAYRRFKTEQFANSTGYVEDPGASRRLSKALVQSEIEFGQQKLAAEKNAEELAANIKGLKQEQENAIHGSAKSVSDVTELNPKFFDNKELYSILINGLNMHSYNPKEDLSDSYGLKNVNYVNDKTDFTRTVTDAINVSCELLRQKQDYKYVSKCVKTIKDIDGAAKIHNLLIRAYTYTTHPKHISNREIDPYLVNKLNKNIKNIITVGRRVLFAKTNTCKCKTGKNKTLLQNNLKGLVQMAQNIQGQISNIESTLNGAKISIPPFMSNLPGFNAPSQRPINKKLVENLKTLYQQKLQTSSSINTVTNAIREADKFAEVACQPC